MKFLLIGLAALIGEVLELINQAIPGVGIAVALTYSITRHYTLKEERDHVHLR